MTWSAGSDSGTVCKVVLIVADMVLLLALTVVAGAAEILTSVSLIDFFGSGDTK